MLSETFLHQLSIAMHCKCWKLAQKLKRMTALLPNIFVRQSKFYKYWTLRLLCYFTNCIVSGKKITLLANDFYHCVKISLPNLNFEQSFPISIFSSSYLDHLEFCNFFFVLLLLVKSNILLQSKDILRNYVWLQ